MVDVGHKPDTERTATAKGEVVMKMETLRLIREGEIKKGDVLTVALPEGNNFLTESIERNGKRVVEPMLKEITGRSIRLAFGTVPEGATGRAAGPIEGAAEYGEETPPELGKSSQSAAVEKVLKMFGGRVVGGQSQ